MIPLRDNIPHFRPPYVNYAIIAASIAAFFLEMSSPHLQRVIYTWGYVPKIFLANPAEFLPLFTSLFLHGGFLHLLGNMWFLYIFGDNVEDTLGHGRYLVFYLAAGVGANFIYTLFDPLSAVPLVGASGAIAGVMGAYFTLFPGARVLTLVPIFLFITVIELPAYIFLGIWLFLQFLFGTVAITGPHAQGGVAWWAHVGGFLVGIVLLYILAPGRVRSPWRRGD